MSYSESTLLSYWSTQTITVITTVPCEVYTTYTTLTTQNCPNNCPDATPTVCDPKSCTQCGSGTTAILSTQYSADEIAPATVYADYTIFGTSILGSQCTSYAQFVDDGSPWDLPSCGPTTIPPVVESYTTCIASPCFYTTVSICPEYTDCEPTTSTIYTYTSYASDQIAFAGDPPTEISASSCIAYTSPVDGDFGVTSTEMCGATDIESINGGGNNEGTTCASSVVTYTYSTDGAIVVEVTTMPGHCGPFLFTGSNNGANAMETAKVSAVFWLWCVAAMLSGVGMLVL